MSDNRKVRVAVFVDNNCLRDNRVIRSSEAIAEAGYDVRVFCRDTRQGIVHASVVNNVQYQRNWISTLYYAQNIRAQIDSLIVYLFKIPGGIWGKFNFLVTAILLMQIYGLKWCIDYARKKRKTLNKKHSRWQTSKHKRRHKALVKAKRDKRFYRLKYYIFRVFFFFQRRIERSFFLLFKLLIVLTAGICAFVPVFIGGVVGGLGLVWVLFNRFINGLQQPNLNIAQQRAKQARDAVYEKSKPPFHRRLLDIILNDKSDETYVSRITKYRAARIYQLTKQKVIDFKPDIIHAHDLVNLPVGVLLGQDTGARVIYDAHEFETARDRPSHKRWKKEIRKFEEYFACRADSIITISDALAGQLEQIHSIKRPIVIYNTPDLRVAKMPEVDIRKELNLSEDTPLGVYVGGLKITRGLPFFIDAAKNVPNLHIVACGPRTANAEAAFTELVTQAGMQERFHMVGPIAPEYLLGYLQSADFSIMPTQNIGISYIYAMPNKFFESILSNIPIMVGKDIVVMADLVERHNLGVLVQQDDPSLISDGMRDILERSQEIKKHMQSQDFNAQYGWETQVVKLVDLYADLTDRNSYSDEGHPQEDLVAAEQI